MSLKPVIDPQISDTLNNVLTGFGLNPNEHQIEQFGSGLINQTFKVNGPHHDYILQQINTEVFKSPRGIAKNLVLLQSFLKETQPDYLFVAPLPTLTGDYLINTKPKHYFRLLPFVKASHTLTVLQHEQEAYEAAKQFGKFTYLLNDFDAHQLEYTIANFHNLKLRFKQFTNSLKYAKSQRLLLAAEEIKEVSRHYHLLQTYNRVLKTNQLPLRVIHHDTKISNVLFDNEKKGLCVIDLDTVMPGYFFSDVGDMMRTYLSPASEEEADLEKVQVRESFFAAIYEGYRSEMKNVLTPEENKLFIFAGKMMIYMQAMRFLTDFLNNDFYYGTSYEGQNLLRAKNQFELLNEYVSKEEVFERLMVHG